MNQSKIFALTSEFEGLPMVLVESIAYGVPVVSFDIADIPDLVQNSKQDYLVEYPNINDFASKIQLCHNDQDGYSQLRENCLKMKESYKEVFSIYFYVQLWEKVI